MNWIAVKHLPLDQDLSELTRFLHRRGLNFRVTEEGGRQVIAVQDPQYAEPLSQLIDDFLRGEVQLPADDPAGNWQPEPQPKGIPFWMTPVTLILIVLSGIGALLTRSESGQVWAMLFLLLDVAPDFRSFLSLEDTLANGQVWRLITPAFLHFGLFHFLFNSLWMWDFGRRLELGLGRGWYLVFFAVTAIAANLTQYFWEASPWFGGMSGVVYALVGFLWIRQRFAPHPLFAVPASIIGFMLFWLVLCMTGIVDQFIEGRVANAAHVGGLIAGMILGALSGVQARNHYSSP